jgi:hypothetical protein
MLRVDVKSGLKVHHGLLQPAIVRVQRTLKEQSHVMEVVAYKI